MSGIFNSVNQIFASVSELRSRSMFPSYFILEQLNAVCWTVCSDPHSQNGVCAPFKYPLCTRQIGGTFCSGFFTEAYQRFFRAIRYRIHPRVLRSRSDFTILTSFVRIYGYNIIKRKKTRVV